MNRILLMLGVVLSSLVEAAPPKSVEDSVVDYLRDNGSNAELHVVTPEIREKVVEQLRQYAKGYDPRLKTAAIPEARAWVALIRLRDPETVEKFVRGTKQWAAGQDPEEPPRIGQLDTTRDPSFVATFSEDFLREDGTEIVQYTDQDVSWFQKPRSIDVAIYVLKLIAACPEFNQETRTWAKAYGNSPSIKRIGVSEFRKALRVWWKENEQSFKSENYGAVRPGQSLPSPTPVAQVSGEAPRRDAVDASEPSRILPGVDSAQEPATLGQLAKQRTASENWNLYLLGAIAVVVALTVVVILRKKG